MATWHKPVPEQRYTFTFTADETNTLISILRRVGGPIEKSPRKHASDVLDSLVRAMPRHTDRTDLIEDGKQSIYFKSYPVVKIVKKIKVR